MTYVEQLAQEAARAYSEPRECLTKAELTKLKSALTRAKKSGDGAKVLVAVEQAVALFNQKMWPDNWNNWRVALEDAAYAELRNANLELADELHAASLVLFR